MVDKSSPFVRKNLNKQCASSCFIGGDNADFAINRWDKNRVTGLRDKVIDVLARPGHWWSWCPLVVRGALLGRGMVNVLWLVCRGRLLCILLNNMN